LNGIFEIAESLESSGDWFYKTAANNVSHSLKKEFISIQEYSPGLSHDTIMYHK
jgi:hypothetical protein